MVRAVILMASCASLYACSGSSSGSSSSGGTSGSTTTGGSGSTGGTTGGSACSHCATLDSCCAALAAINTADGGGESASDCAPGTGTTWAGNCNSSGFMSDEDMTCQQNEADKHSTYAGVSACP